jgi:hypothetical protein
MEEMVGQVGHLPELHYIFGTYVNISFSSF